MKRNFSDSLWRREKRTKRPLLTQSGLDAALVARA